jgi:hypothetical protein
VPEPDCSSWAFSGDTSRRKCMILWFNGSMFRVQTVPEPDGSSRALSSDGSEFRPCPCPTVTVPDFQLGTDHRIIVDAMYELTNHCNTVAPLFPEFNVQVELMMLLFVPLLILSRPRFREHNQALRKKGMINLKRVPATDSSC